MPSAPLMNRDHALALHRSGHVAEAIAAYERLLAEKPGDADLLGLLGIANEQIGNAPEAERLLRMSLDDRASVPLLYRNLNNLLGLLLESGCEDEARSLVEGDNLPTWPDTRTPDPVEENTLISLSEALRQLGQERKALEIVEKVSPHFKAHLDFATMQAELLHGSGRVAEARDVLAQHFGPNEQDPRLHALRSAISFQLGDRAAAVAATERFVATSPALLAAGSSSQHFVLAVFNKKPELISDFRPVGDHHYSGNFPSQLASEFAGKYRFISIFADAPNALDAIRNFPRPALALNNLVNAEQLRVDNAVEQISSVEDRLGVPVLNHPRLAMQATRQKNSERLGNIAGVIVPTVSRYVNTREQRQDLLADIEGRYAYPLILRTVFQQMGKGTWLVHDRGELTVALDETLEQQIYLINYVDLRHENGFHRRLRATFINKKWTIIRVDYSDFWNVRGRREHGAAPFYEANPDLLTLSDRITLSPHEFLDAGALAKLDEVAAAMPLDIFGMDFDITDEGQLAIFEANATMNFLDNSQGGLSYPPQIQKRLTEQFHKFFSERAAR